MRMRSDRQLLLLAKPYRKRPENQLRHILLMLEKNVADWVQDTDSMQRVFLAIKGDPSPALSRVLSYLSAF